MFERIFRHMNTQTRYSTALFIAGLLFGSATAADNDKNRAAPIAPGPLEGAVNGAKEKQTVEPKRKRAEAIQDNSFLVEEAYNQEPGVVQHVFNFAYDIDKRPHSDERTFSAAFTQEWPVLSQRHQLSYTVPFSSVRSNGQTDSGIGDIQIHYRYQALMEDAHTPAFAPRITLSLPTGDDDEGFGEGKVAYQANLPVSKVLNDRWTIHFNAGTTVIPDLRIRLEDGARSRERTLVHYNLGFSTIYAVTENFNLMLESVGLWEQEFNDRGNLDRKLTPIVSPGFRYAINLPETRDAQLVLGLAMPIGLNKRAPDYGVFFYLSFEHNF